jgi:putative heme-binding domain-containing protein
MGPSLRRAVLVRAPDDSAFARLLAGGIPERGMPAAWQLNPAEIADLIGYVRSLGQVASGPVAGDSARGRAIFAGKGTCSTCHMVSGIGGSFGPELTLIGAVRGADFLRQSLVDPGAALPAGPQTNYAAAQFARYLPVRAITATGEEIAGVRVNEDRFSIQIRAVSGRLFSLQKATLRSLDKRFGESLMPSYASVLRPNEISDLVAYLASLRGSR